MAVANILTFGGISTATYGLVVEGSGDYSAPKRAVETIEIPGRNGAFQLDKGYYENIEVEYNIVVKDATQADFRDAIDSYRNAIVSQIGYQRLEDTYHPNEYRMAMYAGGLDEEPAFHGNGAIFKIKFDCKPQRFLTSGETEITVTSGDTLTSPTHFASSPLIKTHGYGTLTVGDHPIELTTEEFGRINLDGCITHRETVIAVDYTPYVQKVDFGDTITITRPSFSISINTGSGEFVYGSLQLSLVSYSEVFNYVFRDEYLSSNNATGALTIYPTLTAPAKETSTFDAEFTLSGQVTIDGQTQTFTANLYLAIRNSYIPSQEQAAWTFRVIGLDDIPYDTSLSYNIESAYVDSTASVLGNPTYIDCDYGEAYKIEDGKVVSLNGYIALGSDLPVLSPDGTEITYDNTFTSVKVVPRWWKI